jgi:hypothetical protein
MGLRQVGKAIIQPSNSVVRMPGLALASHAGRWLDGDDLISERCQPCSVSSRTSAYVKREPRGMWHKIREISAHVTRCDAFIALGEDRCLHVIGRDRITRLRHRAPLAAPRAGMLECHGPVSARL